MITELAGMPAGVIGFEASGKIRAEDYRDVVMPAIERAANAGEVRFLIVMREFGGLTGGALWQDLKVGLEYLRAWKRIALVTDIPWVTHATDLFGWMTPGEVKTFGVDGLDAAVSWVSSNYRPERPGQLPPRALPHTSGVHTESGRSLESVPMVAARPG